MYKTLLPQECLRFVDKCALNKAQKDAVRNVLDPAYQSVSKGWTDCTIYLSCTLYCVIATVRTQCTCLCQLYSNSGNCVYTCYVAPTCTLSLVFLELPTCQLIPSTSLSSTPRSPPPFILIFRFPHWCVALLVVGRPAPCVSVSSSYSSMLLVPRSSSPHNPTVQLTSMWRTFTRNSTVGFVVIHGSHSVDS